MARQHVPEARSRQANRLLLLGGMAIVAVGCGGPERQPVYRVRGELYWAGKPAGGAVVFLHPIGEVPSTENPAQGPRPAGRVQEDGSFQVSTYGINDGAPAGRYRLSVRWTKPKPGPIPEQEESLIPPEYGDPRTSLLPIVEVREEDNVLPPLRLSKEVSK